MTKPVQDAATLKMLYGQIEEICRHFKQIRQEAAGIVENSQMPDAALHLNDVLESTETATNTILDAATQIGSIAGASALDEESKQKLNEQVGMIYEACSFQDISGQRIKKVLRHLSELEEKLMNLSESAKGQQRDTKPVDPLLNGPALSAVAPSQAEVDALFKQN